MGGLHYENENARLLRQLEVIFRNYVLCVPAKTIKEFRKIIGKGDPEVKHFASNWMSKPQFCGMQCQSRCATAVFNHSGGEWLSIFDIAANEMATLGKMNTDLVGATGFQLAFDQ